MSVFTPFSIDDSVSDDVFNQSVSGNSFLGRGTHEVTVDSVEPGAYDDGVQFIDVVYVNEEKKSFKDRVTLGMVADKNDPNKMTLTFPYRRFCGLLPMANDEQLSARTTFFRRWFTSDIKNLGAVIGMTAKITIVEGYKGFSVKEDDLGAYYGWDVKLKERIVTEPAAFIEYKDAKEALESKGLKRSFDQLGTLEALNGVENYDQAVKAMSGIASAPQIKRQSM